MSSAKKTGIFFLSLAVLAGLAGTAACQKKADEGAAAEVRKAVTEFDGTVKAALGRYMYLSTAQGFDIVLPGFDAASLLGKDVVVKGNLLVDHPPIFLADSVSLKADGSNAYTRSQEFQADLDMISGVGVAALGHANPRLSAAIAEQATTLLHTSNLYFHPLQGELATRLSDLSGLPRAFFCNSGAEAVEACLKFARR